MSKDKNKDKRYVLYIIGYANDIMSRSLVPVFKTPELAHAYLKLFLKDELFKVADSTTVLLAPEFEIVIKSHQLTEILASNPNSEDDVAEHSAIIKKFKRQDCVWFKNLGHEGDKPVSEAEPAVAAPAVRTRPEPVARPPKSRRSSVPSGYVSIVDLASASGSNAMNIRSLLRASGYVKPDYGWWFSPDDIKKVKILCGIK